MGGDALLVRGKASMKQNVKHLALEPNPGSWNRVSSPLLFDNLIGTGFIGGCVNECCGGYRN